MASLTEILLAALPVIGTVLGSYMGVRASTKLTLYRLGALEKKVDKHNNFAERVPLVEEIVKCIPDIETKIASLQNEINTLKICSESSKNLSDKFDLIQNDVNDIKILIAKMSASKLI